MTTHKTTTQIRDILRKKLSAAGIQVADGWQGVLEPIIPGKDEAEATLKAIPLNYRSTPRVSIEVSARHSADSWYWGSGKERDRAQRILVSGGKKGTICYQVRDDGEFNWEKLVARVTERVALAAEAIPHVVAAAQRDADNRDAQEHAREVLAERLAGVAEKADYSWEDTCVSLGTASARLKVSALGNVSIVIDGSLSADEAADIIFDLRGKA